jgi:hypothetical protein
MRKKLIVALMAFALLVAGSVVFAQDKAAPEDAKAMVEKAVAYAKENGKEKALAEIGNPQGQFVKGELYVFAQSFDGVMLAHGANPKMAGQNHLELKDAEGKQFVKELIEVAKTKGNGWVDYKWTHPVAKKIQPKTAYVQAMDGYFLGCGVYK